MENQEKQTGPVFMDGIPCGQKLKRIVNIRGKDIMEPVTKLLECSVGHIIIVTDDEAPHDELLN